MVFGPVLQLVRFVVRRYVVDVTFTDQALAAFIYHCLTTKRLADLTRAGHEPFCAFGRSTYAHWNSEPSDTFPGAVFVEFDVHPSKNPVLTISRSMYVFIRNEAHLARIKQNLLSHADDPLRLTHEEEHVLAEEMKRRHGIEWEQGRLAFDSEPKADQ